MARHTPTRTSKRTIGPRTRFAPDLLALEDRSVPARIYVDLAFTGTDTTGQPGSPPNQAFNTGGTGPLGTVPAAGLIFVAPGDPNVRISGGTTASFATSDITTAFNAARDNPGEDTILLAPGVFALDNSQGQSLTGGFGGFNDNTYFFNKDNLNIFGSGPAASIIRPTASTFDPADTATANDPVFAIRQGAGFIGTDFRLDGSQGQFGLGIGVSGNSSFQLQRTDITALSAGGGAFGDGVLANGNGAAFFDIRESTFEANARSAVVLVDSNGSVTNNSLTGGAPAGTLSYGVEAQGTSTVFVSGNTITGYTGTVGASSSAGVAGVGGARLLVFGNVITGNALGVGLGNTGQQTDTSTAVVNFNDLSNNTVAALDATNVQQGAGVVTGVDAGIDGRNNYFGAASGPLRVASTGSSGDAQVNPAGTGSAATGNVQIGLFRPVTVPRTLVSLPGAITDPNAVAQARANFLGAGVALKIYVNGLANQFTGTPGANPNQAFNPAGTGPLGTTPASQLTFVAANTPFGPGGVTAAGSYAVPDLTTAFGLARDNPGADIIYLAASDTPFALDNAFNGQSTQAGGFNDNTYFFNNSPLTILGSGKAVSQIAPQASTYDPLNAATDPSDPLLAIRQGGSFVGSDFALSGAGKLIGVGIGSSGGSSLTLTNLAVSGFSAVAGTPAKAGFGFGVAVNNQAAGLGGAAVITSSSFSGNASAGVSLTNGDGQIIGSTFTGLGAGSGSDVGAQALGASSLFVTGSTFTGYLGASGGSPSAALVGAQVANAGATLLAVGNVITGNNRGVVLGNLGANTDSSKAVVQYNNLQNNTVALDATSSLAGPAVTTGVDAGIDGRFNFFGGNGPNRQASTGSNGDQAVNPTGTGSQANGNVRINGFRTAPVQTLNPAGKSLPYPFATGVTLGTAGSAQTLDAARAAAVTPYVGLTAAPATKLTIYVNGTNGASNNSFTDTDNNGKADQAFNPSGVGPLGTVAGNTLQFAASGSDYATLAATLGYVAGNSYSLAVPDITTAFNLARDNPGADVIDLAASDSAFTLDNSQGQSASGGFGGFNDNTYFFNGAGNTLTINGSGQSNSLIRPLVSTYDPANAGSESDPVFAVRQGSSFTGSDFAFDGSAGKFGVGIGASGGSNVSLTRVGVRNFVALDGSTNGGASFGFGVFVNNAAGTTSTVTVVDSKFSGNGRVGVGAVNASGQVLGSTFAGRGAGDLVDYGVQFTGTGNLYVSGSRFSGFLGKTSSDGTQSAGISVSQDLDTNVQPAAPVAGGVQLLAVGNSIVGNRIGVAVSNFDGTGTSAADLRFNDLSQNATAVDTTTGGGAASAAASNNFLGGAPTNGTVTVTNARGVTAPTLTIDSTFGTAGGPTLAAAAPAAGTAYRTDPRVQSPVTIAGSQTAAGSDVVFTVTYGDVLFNQDKSLFSATYTPTGGTAQTFTSGQLTISAPTTQNGVSVVTVTVPASLLTGASGTVRLVTVASGGTRTAPATGTAQEGNLQLTVNGYQTAGQSADVQYGVANTGPTITRTSVGSVTVTPTGSVVSNFTVTVSPGRTIASVTAASSNPAITVTRVAGSPDSAPQFTISSSSTAVGSGLVTVTATDSEGRTATANVAVQFGVANTGVTLAPINNLTFNVNGPSQQVGTTVTYSPGRTGTVTFSVSPNNLVTVVQGGTSTNPTFTITPLAGAVGSGVVTVTATDSDGIRNSTAFAVQVGTGASGAPTISGLPDQTIPYAGTTGPLTVNVAGVNQPLTVTGSSSNPGVATVTVTGTGASRTVTVTANPSLTLGGSAAITLTATDAQGVQTVTSFNVTVAPQRVRRFAAGTGPGSTASVQVYDVNGVRLFGFTPFELSFTGGVTVATGDVNGDGVDDIVVGAWVGGGPRVKVFDGQTGVTLADFFAFEGENRNGVTVAVGKVLNTGTDARGYFREQVIVGAGDGGGPRVVVYDITPGKGSNPSKVADFFAYESTFRNGVTVAAGDLTGDGLAEIVTGSGFGGGPRVRSFNANGTPAGLDFNAFDAGYRGGVSVAAGDLDGSGKASVVVGVGPDGGSLVRVFSSTGTQKAQFQAYGDAGTASKAVRVGAVQFGTGGESIVTGPGVGGGPRLQVFRGTNPTGGAVYTDFSFAEAFRGGIFVG